MGCLCYAKPSVASIYSFCIVKGNAVLRYSSLLMYRKVLNTQTPDLCYRSEICSGGGSVVWGDGGGGKDKIV